MSAWGRGGAATSCDALLRRVENNDPGLADMVILPMKSFGREDVERVASALSSGANTRLRSIGASGHAVPPSALSSLGRAIAVASRREGGGGGGGGIRSLAIGDRRMGDDGVVALCSGLEPCKGGTILTLDLGLKGITSRGMKVIGSCFGASENLQHLNLSRNGKVADDGIILFCEAASQGTPSETFPSLEYLDLSECSIGPRGMQALSECLVDEGRDGRSKQIDLMLVSNPLGRESCLSVSKLMSSPSGGHSPLVSLSLTRCSIGDDGIAVIVDSTKPNRCVGLRRLDLSHNDIGEQGAHKLSEALSLSDQDNGEVCWADLCDLRLAGNALGSNGVCVLTKSLQQRRDLDKLAAKSGNATLRVLDLSETNCGVEGAVAALQCGSLSTLHLFNNNLGSEGFDRIAPLLQGGHPSLETLDLGGNRAEEAEVAGLLRAVLVKNIPDGSKLQTLVLGGNEFGTVAERVLEEVKESRPNLDVAHSPPHSNGAD